MKKPEQQANPEDWREIHTTWQGGTTFLGRSSKGNLVPMGAVSDPGASPMELLLIALAGCTGMDIVGILEKKRKNIDQFELTVRGLRRFEDPRIYTNILVHYELWSEDLDPASLEQAIRLSEEKYCSVSGMFGVGTQITSTYQINKSSSAEEFLPAGQKYEN